MEAQEFDQEFNKIIEEDKDFVYFVGDSNAEYYFNKKKKQTGDSLFPSWNFASFFAPGYWLLYRKLYKWFIGFTAVNLVLSLLLELIGPTAAIIGNIVLAVLMGIFGNAIYITHAKKKVKSLKAFYSQFGNEDEHIKANGGTNIVAPLVLLAISLFMALSFLIIFSSFASSFANFMF
ncbi:MAG: DUF2628 domain-containing protein [Clostridium sp.]|uniref:DUF2628 domain-containing protein n=1 Tax=Clostridium sp. TaxID=1506 RepID=UPI003F366CDA